VSAPPPLVVYFDGASRGNPGPASYGVYSPSGIGIGERIGTTTNNVAEWRGFLAALDAAIAAGAPSVEIRADSELVLKQFSGQYKMKAAHLAGYLREAREKARRIPRLELRHVPRAQNKEADRLANVALDLASSLTAPDGAEGIASSKSPATAVKQRRLFDEG